MVACPPDRDHGAGRLRRVFDPYARRQGSSARDGLVREPSDALTSRLQRNTARGLQCLDVLFGLRPGHRLRASRRRISPLRTSLLVVLAIVMSSVAGGLAY